MKLRFKLRPVYGSRNDLWTKQSEFKPVSAIVIDRDNEFYGQVFISNKSDQEEFPETFGFYKLKKIG
ncbi:hypothetical protein LCGC14_1846370 [marine sediment metagenome]|uniref:Uncharacterized protein n=1 Tax=marine sediment metagenome TaxID=412755 RepID=A0A0F9IRE5_9ZZZZ